MGLDNGICVRRTPQTAAIPELLLFEKEWDKEHNFNYEVCYWRKCWNIRSIVLDAVTGSFNDSYEIALSVADVDRIAAELKSLTKENWEDEGWCIWEFDDMKDALEKQIHNLGILRRLMQEHELEVYFYDSY